MKFERFNFLMLLELDFHVPVHGLLQRNGPRTEFRLEADSKRKFSVASTFFIQEFGLFNIFDWYWHDESAESLILHELPLQAEWQRREVYFIKLWRLKIPNFIPMTVLSFSVTQKVHFSTNWAENLCVNIWWHPLKIILMPIFDWLASFRDWFLASVRSPEKLE